MVLAFFFSLFAGSTASAATTDAPTPASASMQQLAKSLGLPVEFFLEGGLGVKTVENTKILPSVLAYLNDTRIEYKPDGSPLYFADKFFWDLAQSLGEEVLRSFKPRADRTVTQQEFSAFLIKAALSQACTGQPLRGRGYPIADIQDSYKDLSRILNAVQQPRRFRDLGLIQTLGDIQTKADQFNPSGSPYDAGVAFLRYRNAALLILANEMSEAVEKNLIALNIASGRTESFAEDPEFPKFIAAARYPRVLEIFKLFSEYLATSPDPVIASAPARWSLLNFLPGIANAATPDNSIGNSPKVIKELTDIALKEARSKVPELSKYSLETLRTFVLRAVGFTTQLGAETMLEMRIPGVHAKASPLRVFMYWIYESSQNNPMGAISKMEVVVKGGQASAPLLLTGLPSRLSWFRFVPRFAKVGFRFLGPAATAYTLAFDAPKYWPTLYTTIFKDLKLNAESKSYAIDDAYFTDYEVPFWVNLEEISLTNITVDGLLTIKNFPRLKKLSLRKLNQGGTPRILFQNISSELPGPIKELEIEMIDNQWGMLPSFDTLLAHVPADTHITITLYGNNLTTAAPVVEALLKLTSPIASKGSRVDLNLSPGTRDAPQNVPKNPLCVGKDRDPRKASDQILTERWKLFTAAEKLQQKRTANGLGEIHMTCEGGKPDPAQRNICVGPVTLATIANRGQFNEYDAWSIACVRRVVLLPGSSVSVLEAKTKFPKALIEAKRSSPSLPSRRR